MTDHLQAGQGTIVPSLFIGMGGIGSRIVDRIASHARRLTNWKSQLEPLTAFVSVDTNEGDQHKLRHIPPGNRINIAAFDKVRAIEGFRRSKDHQALQWLDKAYQPRAGYKPGAGQIRVESRLGFFYHSPEIRKRLQHLVADALRPGITWRQSKPPKYNVYIFCTLAGGTGSGSFLPMAYLVQDVIEDLHWQPRLVGNFLLSTLLLDKVGTELHPDIHANTYAALKELEHLTKLDYAQTRRERKAPEKFVFMRDENNPAIPDVTRRPYFIGFLFDQPAHLSLREAERAIADSSYLQLFTPIIDNLAGELDNYEKNLEELTRFPGDLKNVGQGYSKNFGTFGASVLVLPGQELLEYCSQRFAAHAIRSQITFGIDPNDPGDDRARALARLSVDYSDPKFLRMGDEAREGVINKAFLDSVREMARQDAREELLDGFWYQLVDVIDNGRVTGLDDQGQPVRGESTLQRVFRTLEEDRRDLTNKVSIKERAFVFHREGVNQYIELVNRLLEDVRTARVVIDEGVRGLETSALEGEVVTDLKLDPVQERYLVLRLLELCGREWIPNAEQQLEKAKKRDVSNPKVRERLEKELFESLQEAAAQKRLFKKDQAFLDARDEAQEYYRGIASAARRMSDAEVQLRQLRSLHNYLNQRARQYARLATQMDRLVEELEEEAEKLRRGEGAAESGLTLRVEVFETLDEPRSRIWDQVYRNLFVEEGRSLNTFDRNVLAQAISEQLKPEVKAGGRIVPKTVDRTVNDLRRALTDLGRSRLRPEILGEDERPGLDLARGLELEAQLILSQGKREGEEPTEEEIEGHLKKKFRSLNQVSGVLARVSSEESRAWDDGVIVNRTRQLVIGALDPEQSSFLRLRDKLSEALRVSGRQVKTDVWRDPRLAIVHDVEMPIPLYYFKPVVGEIEEAYLSKESDERRSYMLHIDYHWEKALPNLNPRRSEIAVSWALKRLAEGLLTKTVAFQSGEWVWFREAGKAHRLDDNLSGALYRLGEIHHHEDLNRRLELRIQEVRKSMDAQQLADRAGELCRGIGKMIEDIGFREVEGEMKREDSLDRPVLKALLSELEAAAGTSGEATGAPGGRYSELGV